MRLLDAVVTDISPAPDFGRVEGTVHLIYAPAPGAEPQERVIRTSTPAQDPRGRSLKVRLVSDALQLALRMPADALGAA